MVGARPCTLRRHARQGPAPARALEGESEDDLESPAPAVVLTAAEGEHGAAAEEEPAAHMEQASAEVDTAGASTGDDLAPEWVTIVALVLGALGLVAGVAGLTAARRRSA
jgi:periplasmic copper chaperone A